MSKRWKIAIGIAAGTVVIGAVNSATGGSTPAPTPTPTITVTHTTPPTPTQRPTLTPTPTGTADIDVPDVDRPKSCAHHWYC